MLYVALILFIFALLFFWQSNRQRQAAGLPGGRVIYTDTRGWGKGTVFVNGHHLGRFWSIGPQQTLYIPGPWLRKGANDIVVFTLDEPTKKTMTGLDAPVLNELVK